MDDKPKIIIEVDELQGQAARVQEKLIRMLSFSVGGENYCLDIRDIKEVLKPGRITRVPNTPQFITGVMNLRGEIIAVIELRHFLGLAEKEIAKETMVIVTDIKVSSVGLLVDRIKEAVDIPEPSIQPPLATIKGDLLEYTKGQVQLGDGIYAVLDLKKILNCKELERLRKGE